MAVLNWDTGEGEGIKKMLKFSLRLKLILSTSSLISPSFQAGPTIFHMVIFLKQTPHIKNYGALRNCNLPYCVLSAAPHVVKHPTKQAC